MKSKSALHLPASATAKPRRILAALLVPLVAAFFPAAAAHAQTVTSAVPGFISYQGKVSNAAGALVGAGTPVNRTVIFRIWSHPSNSTVNDLVYSEQQTVTISEGEFSVLIGQGSVVSGTPLGYSESAKGPPSTTVASAAVFGGATRYLGVTIDDPSASADPEVSPRQQLVTSAYAFRAKYAETVGANGANTLTALDNGNVGIGSSNPGARLEVNGSIRAGGAGTPNPMFSLLANSSTTLASSIGFANSAGNFSTDAAAGDTVFRTENGGKLLLQTGVGASALTISSNNYVGIANANPGALLHIGTGANAGPGGLVVNTGWVNTADFAQYRPLDVQIRGTSHLVVNTQGNVGIGTSTPGQTLDVNGNANIGGFLNVLNGTVRVSGAGGLTFASNGDTDGGIFSPGDGIVTIRTNNVERVRVDPSGRVGIGTNNPGHALQVVGSNAIISVGDAAGGAGGIYLGNINHGVVRGYNGVNNDVALYTTSGSVILGAHAGANHLIVRNSGRVGIGWTDPQVPLHVNGQAGITFNVEADGWGHGWFDVGNQLRSHALSIIASDGIRASSYFVNSDARLKRVLGRSSGSADLALLQQIEITDYAFKDTRSYGSRPQKKVVAQQLEEVFPQAVNQASGVIPDVYAPASTADGWVILETDLKVGERIQLIADGKVEVHEVLEVEAGRFRTAFKPKAQKLFVYGREVPDLRSVDYEAIAMLNVSATQELKRQHDTEVAALRAANAQLEQRLAELEAKDRARDTKLAAIEKLFAAGQTVMARPAASTSRNANGQE